MTYALQVDHLAVRFGTTEVIRDLSFAVPHGSSLAVIGPNGAGKTVLFKALIGSIAYQGTIRWAAGTRIGYVPQKLDIERDLPITGLDFLHAKAALAKASDSDVANALERVGLERPMLSAPIGTMSGGQFQRLLVAFALVGKPNVLLLDEPAAGIDEPGQEILDTTIRRLQQENDVTVLLISHDLSVVYHYADAVLCLSRTHPCFGTPQTVLTPDTLRNLYGTAVDFHVHNRSRN
ncbi:MAG: metal ABC transporter ATP-binding protein [Candidatus Binataceae bacterium]|jgi:zinc transport system ATP-binding protein